MRILALGDIIAPAAVDFLAANLWEYRRREKIDFVVANGENASFLGGIGAEAAEKLLLGGVDVITGGNHSLQNRGVYPLHEEEERVLRPINYPADVPGRGYTLSEAGGVRVLVVNAMGTALIEPVLDNPIPYIRRVLAREAGAFDVALLDLHAEATGEKLAVAHIFDGSFAAVFGTHTHVPTADLQILPRGTGYVTDLGATAPTGGILGVRTEVICARTEQKLSVPYRVADGAVCAEGVIFDIDEHHNRCTALRRVTLRAD